MKNILYTLLLTIVFVGCEDRLKDLNTDKKKPSSADAQSLFANATKRLVDNITSTDVNDNPFRLYSQMWAQTAYPQESRYNMTARNIPENFYIGQYRNVLVNLSESKKLIALEIKNGTSSATDATLANRMAIIDVLMGYTYSTLVDVFGNVPYSEALQLDKFSLPKYDDAAGIYSSIDASLATASTLLTKEKEAGGFDSDLIYNGDAEAWARFANSIRLRMAMKIADVDATNSILRAKSAVAAGVFTENAHNFSMTYGNASPNTNPVHISLVLSGRADYVASNTITDIMNANNDPRRAVYFRENLGKDVFKGGIYGTGNSYKNFTQLGEILHKPTTAGKLMGYAEVEFLLAEMAQRGEYGVTGSASSHYDEGIKASFEEWGVAGFTEYISKVAYSATNWKQNIGVQLWLALYNQGLEGWSTWRRFDFTGFNPPPEMKITDIPVRFTYPLSEATLNRASVTQTASDIGGDETSTKVFWDVN